MKIERLINIFEQLLPIYEKGYKEVYDKIQLIENDLDHGLCAAVMFGLNIEDSNEFTLLFSEGYYKYLVEEDGYLFNTPNIGIDLKPRIDFMKSEIKNLKRLLKKGYTHV